ncbi:Zinc finger, C3HC4 type (RING finger)/TRAF-type zinc finger containing protein [Novymonas esmeraldas]|uniref:Zinc finger, C3HC4 type (RING finger)/TRAF-type zinc finger containing protein n=1 Tax=Novymonas esmeraldas TaxID=1808958 RepID=A0AAW0ELH1_9TRYP
MRDTHRAQTPSPSASTTRHRGRAASDNSSGGGDRSTRLNTAVGTRRQRPRRRPAPHPLQHDLLVQQQPQHPWRGSDVTDTADSTSNSTSHVSGGAAQWTNAPPASLPLPPSAVGGAGRTAIDGAPCSPPSSSSTAATATPVAVLNALHGSEDKRALSTAAAGVVAGRGTPPHPFDAAIVSAASASSTASDAAPPLPMSAPPLSFLRAAAPCQLRSRASARGTSPSSPGTSPASPHYGQSTTAASSRPRRLMPPPALRGGTAASTRRSRSCPNTRSAAAGDAALTSTSSWGILSVGAAARPRAASDATYPARSLRSAATQPSSDSEPRGPASPPTPTPTFTPLGLLRASPPSATVGSGRTSAATSGSPVAAAVPTAGAAAAADGDQDDNPELHIGTLLTHELDGGVVIVDPRQTPDDLICGVCMSVCRQPTATTCGHLFCRRCLQSWMLSNVTPVCPLDRTPIQADQLHTDARAQRQINALPCSCPASLSLAAQRELLRLSPPHPTHCDSAVGVSADNHSDAGDRRATSTAPPRCRWTGCVSDAVAHLRHCPHVLITCPFATHGCTVQVPRSAMAAHLRDCVAEHLLLVSQALVASTDQCRVLQAEVEVLRQRCPMRYPSRTANTVAGTLPAGSEATVSSSSSSSLHAATTTTGAYPAPAPSTTTTTTTAAAAPLMMGPPTSEVSLDSGSLPRAVVVVAAAAAPPPSYAHTLPGHLHAPPVAASVLVPATAHWAPTTAGAIDGGTRLAAQSPAGGHDAATSPRPGGTPPRRVPSPVFVAGPGSGAGALVATTATATTGPAAAPLVSPPPPRMPLSARGVDRFVWVITDVALLQAPCYSRPFTSHGMLWYVGMDTSATWEQCGVYLFAQGHEHRVDFRVMLYHEDPARDVVHVVRDWREDYIGKGWGPLRFINRFTLEHDGFLVRGCLRVGIEVLGDPY